MLSTIMKPGYKCFFCGKEFTEGEQIVEWLGDPRDTPQINMLLHVPHAAQLGVRLIGDAVKGDPSLKEKVEIWREGKF